MHFNFIMILFYYDEINRIVTLVDKFQFHYDLILFLYRIHMPFGEK